MIYIFEGPDGAGKSTMADFLSKITGYKLVHFSNPKTEEEKANMFKMYESLLLNEDNIILDRSWYSDMVYGPVLRGGATISGAQCHNLETLLANKKGQVIYMTAPLRTLLERAYSRGENLIKPHQFVDIVDGYEKLFKDREVLRYSC